MKAQRKDLAAFTIILGVLTLILTVSALARRHTGTTCRNETAGARQRLS